ncbi:MAG: PKD domain-containing protein [Crocinitomicaceae bacterium]
MKKLILTLSLFICAGIGIAQENCANGIDDDADGLIDMNDPDCACSGFGTGSTTVTSLIPNPSFEDMVCCPSSFSQLNCANNWIQASNATSDYFNLCGYTGIFNSPNTPLPGGGSGYGGFYSNQGWEENIGACLNSPMIAGTSYTVQLNTAWSTGSTSLQLTLYGTPNCGDLPWGTSNCAVGSGSWMVLGSVTVNYPSNQSWQQVSITFTPPVNINAVSFGGPCGGMAGTNYYFIDEMTLASSSAFNPGNITESGSWCNNDLMLTADPDTTGGTFQWYQSGVALVGETAATLDLMSYGAGDFNCVYTLNGDCIQMDYTVTLPPYPTAGFTFTNQCDGNAMNFTDNSTITAPGTITGYSWDFGDGNTSTAQNPSNNYASDGTYTVSLTVTDNNGCTNTSTQNVTVYPNPVNDIEFVINGVSSTTGLTGGCLVDAVNFTNNTTINAPDNITTWAWDFGDGNTSNVQNPPAHTYAAAGNYTISLTTTSNNGCTDNITLPITIHPTPSSVFTVPPTCMDFAPVYTNNSAITSGTIATYEWDFGDGNTSGAQNPAHNYASSGTYTVELVVISDQGCTDTSTVTTTIYPEPVSDFTMTSECIINASTITNNSTVAAPDNITVWSWDFDDGTTDNVQNPGTHSFTVESTYNVQLAVETNNGCQDTSVVAVTVNPSPVADFNFTDDCYNVAALFTDASQISSGTISTYNWDFGDGLNSNQQNPSHPYASDGQYTVTLSITSDQGCPDDTTKTITRYPVPAPDFTVSDVCVYDPITVTETGTINAPDTISSWDWDFGDGLSGTGNTMNHFYNVYGTYDITLTATSEHNCINSITHAVDIYPQPIPSFTNTTICVNTPPTDFVSNSTIPLGTIATYNWDFGDGSTSTGAATNHTYGASGTYNSQLLTTSDFGCVDSITNVVTVYEKPTADFVADPLEICSPDSIQFNDLSTSPTVGIIDWQWDFNGGLGSNGPNPVVDYINSGSTPDYYDVELIVTNALGCKDTVLYSNYITVYPTPEANFSFYPTVLDVLHSETQFHNSSVNSDEWEWNFGDLSPISLQEHPSHIFPNDEPREYVVQLISYNYGKMCSDTIQSIVNVQDVVIFYVPNTFTPDGDEFNETWKPVFFSGYDPYDFHMTVFNRWGEIIWESFDASKGWNGHYGNGGLVEDGVYIWSVEFKETMSDKTYEHRGHVTVLK